MQRDSVKLQVTGHEELIEKEDILAWEREYRHLQWGCAGSISHITEMLPPGSKILDVGCGCGRHLFPLSTCYSTTGMDISSIALHKAREYLKKQDRKADYTTASLTHLPFKEETFDAVICLGVLQHLTEAGRYAATREIRRVLKCNGLVFLEVFGSQDMRYGGEEVEERSFMRQTGILYHYFTPEEIRTLFKGFQFLELKDKLLEKKYRREKYIRHMISAVMCYNQKKMPA
ncbi:methylase involved in ubiquinone/menaquinone biosynthesis [Methanomethylovorans hollandica DSM 15978]|uniref:Methylase involved in ubiquinone/menaquinone biosynthesis n=1 Tax=Methanomethylovorans hollandica (strain DSM 15978 / NBRC 107637 / DMS1) TaxID=867904 RepID=L0KUV3_METHD|nr:methylase involved in ubiquinone/menaquinone biosynthesis [Methanomethylovorans hollandica DSM 15978]